MVTLTGADWTLPARSVAPLHVSVTGPVGPPLVDSTATDATPDKPSVVVHEAL